MADRIAQLAAGVVYEQRPEGGVRITVHRGNGRTFEVLRAGPIELEALLADLASRAASDWQSIEDPEIEAFASWAGSEYAAIVYGTEGGARWRRQ